MMKATKIAAITVISLLVVAAFVPVAVAPPVIITVKSTTGVTDERGDWLLGDGSPTSDLVQLINAGSDETINPPDENGYPTSDDSLICAIRIGSKYSQDDGKFSHDLSLESGTVVYCRAWNAALPSTATYYGNSSTMTITGAGDYDFGMWPTATFFQADTTPPSVTNATASPVIIPEDTDNEPRWGENSTLNVTVTDESSITSVTINLSAIGGSANQSMRNIEGSDVWSVPANASNGTAGWNVTTNAYVPYLLQVNATDKAGYSNTSVSLNLTVMKNGDVNEDGNATYSDAMYVFKWWLHKPGFEQINREAADVSGDGVVTAYDALYLFKWYLNKPGFEVLK